MVVNTAFLFSQECVSTIPEASNFLEEYRKNSFNKLSDSLATDKDDYLFVTQQQILVEEINYQCSFNNFRVKTKINIVRNLSQQMCFILQYLQTASYILHSHTHYPLPSRDTSSVCVASSLQSFLPFNTILTSFSKLPLLLI